MSDERLRELERRWQESGAVEDETAYLNARVRQGDLPEERLELAAYLGHPAARAACHDAPVSPRETFGSRLAETIALLDWILGLEAWGREAQVLALVVVGRRLLLEYEPAYPAPVGEKLDALEAWGRCPCEEHRAAARRISIWLDEDLGPEAGAAWTAHHAGQLMALGPDAESRDPALRALWPLNESLLKPQDLRPMIRDALVPWALGWGPG